LSDDWQNGGFGLYIHWPFCLSKCPYCDFNSHLAASVDQVRWKDGFRHEIKRLGRETGPRVLNTVFFGGGTPSLMEPELVASILDCVRATWPMANDAEITLEANPTSVEAARFRGYREAGVNRVSMGFQALNDGDLRRLGRLHTVDEARAALEVAKSVFDRVSFDLIYGRQDQTLDQWRKELKGALEMAADHLSLYQLTIEPGTAFGERFARGGLKGLPTEDLAADLYFLTQEICEAAGLPGYEVSNHARPGSESRHNLIYWRYGDYAGVGPGAHGRLTLGGRKVATDTVASPTGWLEAVEQAGSGESSRRSLSAQGQADEYLMMGLRLTEGISLTRHASLGGMAIPAEKINHLQEIGVLHLTGDRLRATDSGRAVLNAVLRELMTG